MELHIRNFGPIKEADMALRKVNVLTGTTCSGKSTLAKLLAIFTSKEMVSLNSGEINGFEQLLRQYDIDFSVDDSRFIFFKDDSLEYTIEHRHVSSSNPYAVLFASSPEDFYALAKEMILPDGLSSLLESLAKQKGEGFVTPPWFRNLLAEHVSPVTSVYIPAERILIPILSGAAFYFNEMKVPFPASISRFGQHYELAKKQMESAELFSFEIHKDQKEDIVIKGQDGHSIPFRQASSGLLSALPLFMVAGWFLGSKDNILALIEEPELNLYPDKQVALLSALLKYVNKIVSNRLVITTHSPYMLSFLNCAITAGRILREHPEKAAEVYTILDDEACEIQFEDVMVYSIQDGIVRSAMDDELELVSPSDLDSASDLISSMFNKLLEL